jgi:hypothetical protein
MDSEDLAFEKFILAMEQQAEAEAEYAADMVQQISLESR